MKPQSIRRLAILLAIPLAASLLSGCATLLPGSTLVSATTQSLTGNWIFTISDPPAGTPPLTSFVGAITGQGASVTAVFRSAGCVPPTQNIFFTGSQTSSGTLTLTSTNLPSNVATITVSLLTSNGATNALGSLAITGNGPCAIPSIALLGSELQPFTGTYSGTLTANPSTAISVTAALTQGAANSDGQFPESGTVSVAGSGCTNTFSLNGLVVGPLLTANLTSTSGPTATAILGAGPAVSSPQSFLPFSLIILSTGCSTAGGAFTGILNK
jgi:hypothetical protein